MASFRSEARWNLAKRSKFRHDLAMAKYQTGSHTKHRLQYHLVWLSKYRRRVLRGKMAIFLTNNFILPALTITLLFKHRWQIEIFFKWIKQYLRIKAFYGTSPNAVKTQIWIAISVYVLVAIIKKKLKTDRSLS